jgi:ribosomal protein S12 methylthiotransferase accessory factor
LALAATGSFERVVHPEEAVFRARRIATRNGFTVSVRQCGTTVQTTRCELFRAGILVAAGLGKGIGAQSEASALFEAFEHHHWSNESLSDKCQLLPLDLGSIDLALRDSSPDYPTVCGTSSFPLTRICFEPFLASRPALMFPVFLTKPDFESPVSAERDGLRLFGLRRYSTNSGTAAGLSRSEALLHGLLEVIERDAIGIELLRTVIRRDAFPVREVLRSTIPNAIAALWDAIETETDGTLVAWNITTDIGVSTILAALSLRGGGGGRYFGSGASLSSEYALERASLEAVQSFHAHHFQSLPRPRSGTESLSGMPAYVKCFLEAGFFGYRGGAVSLPFHQVPTLPADNILNVDDQLGKIVAVLDQRGMAAFWRSLAEDDLYVTQVVVPKLERFHLVSHGVPVAPATRGRAVMYD